MYNSIADIPGYHKEIESAMRSTEGGREDSFYMAFCSAKFLGVDVHPLRVSDFLKLTKSGHPTFLGDYSIDNCLNLIWQLSPKKDKLFARIHRIRNVNKIIKYAIKNKPEDMSVEDYIATETEEWLNDQLVDVPGRYIYSYKKELQVGDQPTYYCVWAYYFGFLMKMYGMQKEDILELPVGLFFQYINLGKTFENPKYRPDSPVDAVKRKYLKILKELKKKEKEKNG